MGGVDAVTAGDTAGLLVAAVLENFNNSTRNGCLGGIIDHKNVEITVGVLVARGEKGHG